MRPGRSHAGGRPVAAVIGGAILALGAGAAPEHEAALRAHADPAAWRDLVGAPRSTAPVEAASVVVLRTPAAALRPGSTGSRAAGRAARRDQDAALAGLRRAGFRLQVTSRATRALNAVVAVVRPDQVERLAARPEVAGVYPIRNLVPTGVVAAALPTLPTVAQVPAGTEQPGVAVTVAVLDGPLDVLHPALAGRLVPAPKGVTESAAAVPEAAAHATAMAALVTAAAAPVGPTATGAAAQVMPVEVLRPQPDGTLAGTTADLLRGFEQAVDPNGDGDLADRVRVVLAAVEAPFAGFEDTPEARAVAALDSLGTVVVAAAGNDGPTRARHGTVGSPAAAPAAIAVGALDSRIGLPDVALRLDGALALNLGAVPLAAGLAPQAGVPLPVRLVEALDASRPEAYRSADGESAVEGAVAVVTRDAAPLASKVAAAAAAGARVVAVHGGGAMPAGALQLDDRAPVPVVWLDAGTASALTDALRAGGAVSATFGAARMLANPATGTPAPFSSTGLTLDDGAKPDLLLPGVGLPTAGPGGGSVTAGGSSAAAAQAAGLVAALAAAHPDWTAGRLRSALVSTAQPLPAAGGRAVPVEAQGGGVPDGAAAAGAVLETRPTSLAVGRPDAAGVTAPTVLEVTNRDAVARTVTLGFVRDGDEGDTTVHPGADHPVFTLEPGASRRVRVTLRLEGLPEAPAALGGWLLLQLDGGAVQRVPVAVAVGGSGESTPTLVRTPELSRSVLAVDGPAADRRAVTLSARLGAVEARGDGSIVLTPVRRLRVDLYRGGTPLGSVHAARDLLPGRYGWSLTPRGPGGGPLAPGRYRLVLRADGDAGATSTASVTFRVR